MVGIFSVLHRRSCYRSSTAESCWLYLQLACGRVVGRWRVGCEAVLAFCHLKMRIWTAPEVTQCREHAHGFSQISRPTWRKRTVQRGNLRNAYAAAHPVCFSKSVTWCYATTVCGLSGHHGGRHPKASAPPSHTSRFSPLGTATVMNRFSFTVPCNCTPPNSNPTVML